MLDVLLFGLGLLPLPVNGERGLATHFVFI
jgi:hypothetical protein